MTPVRPRGISSLEKILGANHLKSIAWLRRGLEAARSVCRVVCPKDKGTGFLVDGSLRHAGIKLICPFCSHRFLPDDAAKLDERHN